MYTTETDGNTTILRLEHGKANALDLELLQAVDEQLREFEASDQRALVVTGTGSVFCAGVDLFRLLEGGDAYLAGFLTTLNACFRRLVSIEKPIVAAVNGHAIAGGCLLAIACDLRVMAEGRGKVGVTELFVGVPFPAIGLELLRAALAPRAFQDLTLTGRLCGADEAASLGLVHEVVATDGAMPRALELAAHMGSVLPETFALTKRQMRRPLLAALDGGLAAHDEDVAARWRDPEVHATVREFLDATIGKRQ
ncbi:MAG: enoyl-CoA hydratase/isomerase family protein [Planctomycetes bacterium]|nr:enoyl-CoA hydratase/isomerase family protein [Planctomycetota bacterium]